VKNSKLGSVPTEAERPTESNRSERPKGLPTAILTFSESNYIQIDRDERFRIATGKRAITTSDQDNRSSFKPRDGLNLKATIVRIDRD
jgi:hypothetical protein